MVWEYVDTQGDEIFSTNIFSSIVFSIDLMGEIKTVLNARNIEIHITKASFFSWLLFISELYLNQNSEVNSKKIINTFVSLESKRFEYKNNVTNGKSWDEKRLSLKEIVPLFSLFNERASSRVMITSSLLIRDWCISLFYFLQDPSNCDLDINRMEAIKSIIKVIEEGEEGLKSTVETMAESGNFND
jgi:hypothetical protein